MYAIRSYYVRADLGIGAIGGQFGYDAERHRVVDVDYDFDVVASYNFV